MNTLVCNICNEEKSIDCFHFREDSKKYRKTCKSCFNALKKAHYENNRDAAIARQKEYYETNKEEIKEKAKQDRRDNKEKWSGTYKRRYEGNKEEILAYNKLWRDKNPEKISANKKEYYEDHKEQEKERTKKWKKENPEQVRINHLKRRALKASSPFSLTALEWDVLKEHFNYTCLRCNKREPEIKLTADHIIPLSVGGPTTLDNIQPLCQSCNSFKHTKIIDYRN